jgi:peptidoglycan/LPS O-acetylase OafA/YrhL
MAFLIADPSSSAREWQRALIPMVLITLGAALVVLPAAWQQSFYFSLKTYVVIGTIVVAISVLTLLRFQIGSAAGLQREDDYYLHATMTGLTLSALSCIGVAGVAGLVKTQTIHLALNTGPEAAWPQTVDVLTAGGMSLVGVAFYIAQSVRERVAAADFHRGKFWSGMFFRIGEAVIFTLVFVLICAYQVAQEQEPVFAHQSLPVLGLFVGMFVKSGETVVFGLAVAVFELAKRIVPAQPTLAKPNRGPSEDDIAGRNGERETQGHTPDEASGSEKNVAAQDVSPPQTGGASHAMLHVSKREQAL